MILRILLVLMLSFSAASCEEIGYPAAFSVRVIDEQGVPISDATVKTATFEYWDLSGQGFGKDVWKGPEAKTDEDGMVSFEYASSKRGEFSIAVFPVPQGYYQSHWPNYKFDGVVDERWTPKNPTIDYVLKKKRNPIPLCAKSFYLNPTAIPETGVDCGFDLEVGDWVAPYGSGKISDIVFFLNIAKDNGTYNHDCTLEVFFSNEGDGIISVPKPLYHGSELRLGYLAPVSGYEPSLAKKAFADPETKQITVGFDPTQNYYLRIRTKLDENGNIEQANYAKFYGDIEFWVDGNMRFTYYFNSEVNDRNLEFDTSRNLLDGEQINRP